uniref:Uncharacterized protein n=1 Tax=Anguilla anguilla TaxID=7936 RepID=A0A0E9W8A2_ANGAN
MRASFKFNFRLTGEANMLYVKLTPIPSTVGK